MPVNVVTVQGKIYLPSGVVATDGKITARLSTLGSVEDSGVTQRVSGYILGIITGTGDVKNPAGAAFTIIPNSSISPAGTVYEVEIQVEAPFKAAWRERWNVGATTPIDIGDIPQA